MRIADKMNFEQVNKNLSKNRSEMAKFQNRAASQKRVNKPSDDPIAAARVLASKVELSGNKQFQKSLDYAKSFLDYTDQSLGELTENLVRAKELVLGQVSDGSSNIQSRRVVSQEVAQIFNQMVQIGNRKLGDRFIFGGFQTQTAPFDIKGSYSGDAGEMQLQTDKHAFVAMNIPGSKVFLGEGHGALGITDATPQQDQTIESFLENRAKSDAIRKTRQERAEKQKQLAEEAKVRGPASANYNPESNATLGDNRPIVIDQNEGENIFHIVEKMRIALNTNDKAGLQNTIDDIDRAINQVVMARAQVGSRTMALNNFRDTLGKTNVDHKTTISQLEDADIFETVSEMNKTESALQATLQTSGRLTQPSLLDYLR